MSEFAGRRALVTGASSGIGRAIARELAARGACVWAVGRQRAALEDALEARQGSVGRCIEADLGSDTGLQTLCGLLASTDALDIVVHAAAQIHLGGFESVTAAQFDEQYRVNLRAPCLITQSALPALRRRRGHIVFINSTAALQAGRDAAQYAATKGGLRSLADALRHEVNGDGVRVLTVFVGRTATPMQARVHHHEGRTWRPQRLLQPADVAAAVLQALALPATAELYELTMRPGMPPAA